MNIDIEKYLKDIEWLCMNTYLSGNKFFRMSIIFGIVYATDTLSKAIEDVKDQAEFHNKFKTILEKYIDDLPYDAVQLLHPEGE